MSQTEFAFSASERVDRRPAAASEPAPIDAGFLREMIVSDLNWTALQVGTLCVKAVACASSGSRFNLHCMRHLAHDDARVVRLALRYGGSAGLDPAIGRKLEAFYADVSAMRAQIAPLVALGGPTPSNGEKLSRLAPRMRKLALAAVEALGAVAPLARAHLHPNFAEDGKILRPFLERAARGETTDVDRFGAVTPPMLKQRRQSPRASARVACRLGFAGGEVEATLLDVSRDGLGVACKTRLAEGQEVEAIVDGRRLAAVVRRRDGERFGLALKAPLSLNDPLFRGG